MLFNRSKNTPIQKDYQELAMVLFAICNTFPIFSGPEILKRSLHMSNDEAFHFQTIEGLMIGFTYWHFIIGNLRNPCFRFDARIPHLFAFFSIFGALPFGFNAYTGAKTYSSGSLLPPLAASGNYIGRLAICFDAAAKGPKRAADAWVELSNAFWARDIPHLARFLFIAILVLHFAWISSNMNQELLFIFSHTGVTAPIFRS